MKDEHFSIVYDGYKSSEEPLREALCTLGNGYFATRGANETCHAQNNHYPGTYLAGGYNRLKSRVAGELIESEDFVNWPNWLYMSFKIDDQEWFSLDDVDIVSYHQVLDTYRGMLQCTIRFKDHNGKETILVTHRLVHMGSPHLAAIQWTITPTNWSGKITVHSALDGRVKNEGVERYKSLNNNHLETLSYGCTRTGSIYLEVQTCQSRIRMAQAARNRLYHPDGSPIDCKRRVVNENSYIAEELTFDCKQDTPSYAEKVVALYTSRDVGISEPILEATEHLERAGDFRELLSSHQRAWRELWDTFDVEIRDGDESQKVIRLHIFHILQTASPHTYDLDVGIPPRGLHGEAYRGHILWDELFTFPFLNFRNPLLTSEFLLYRHRRLDRARLAAKEAGYRGAMYPWQSGSNGREESQRIHLNPVSGRWIPDETYLQRHVNSAIVYSIWQYFQTTDDKEFLYFFGAEIIFEIALFWSSVAHYNPERQRFEIHGVIGPDEYHTRYPASEKPGINNNAYTNVMAAWVILRAIDILNLLDDARKEELLTRLRIDNSELERWYNISTNMYIPFTNSIIDQFEGYNDLKELDWEQYVNKYGEDIRLDRILEKEGDSVNNYKASKQADVLMLFYLFSGEEIEELFSHLGYSFEHSMIEDNIEYYRHRTSHGSTLSRHVFSWVISRSDRERSWNIFKKALMSDIEDIQGGTTPEGIHLGAMSGTVDMIQRCYTGLEAREDVLHFAPQLPSNLKEIKLKLRYRSHWIYITLNHECMNIAFEKGWGNPIKVKVFDSEYVFSEKESMSFRLEM
ncbi:glycosyl hydrolase family 65 protein [Chitinispirillales bacterium ANBcel5]|uniref:glycoside hydrolase family 65 protein n=1 Tax=Cellulosispirillum alkaliphilum TaxID=3039283 RepID=UPI002A51F65D|nr:glycosyl hydrolase family 65 protein [Chitinispirillales bacterium ANBcel5]